jgi:hypothetical protein
MPFSENKVRPSTARVIAPFNAALDPKGLKRRFVLVRSARILKSSIRCSQTVCNSLQRWATMEDFYFRNLFGWEKSRATRFVQLMETRIEAARKRLKAMQDGSGDLASNLKEFEIELIAMDLLYKSLRLALTHSAAGASPDTKVIAELIEEAMHGGAKADRHLRVLAFGFISSGKPLPEPLGQYVCKLLFGEGPKLRVGAQKLLDRDQHIVRAIQDQIGCGTSVAEARRLVLKALERANQAMTEDALKKVWARRHKFGDKLKRNISHHVHEE